ncbi:ANTH domain-containing protein [Panaeolus papilionaceus]|nr:ANTH domain-containing protein [Panaeolus papilionaceus]
MSSFDKVVKLACKPKAAPPKAKYIDPIIAATWSEDGAVSDVCKALAPRIREPNAIVAFKALIVLHTMIRNGATDNVLSYLSTSDVLKLKNVSTANWEGYAAPQNLLNYALYLDSRIRAYKDLKHDAVKVQADSNRDARNPASIEEEGYRGRKDRNKQNGSAPTRSKTIMGRKLRVMTVEKGLLRETRIVHGMIDALVECRFYLDDLEDELTIAALRMLVKDLLILFQAGNEGVINVLENYFEMSHIDAEDALKIYRRFCKQTEAVVEFLGVAKKLQNLLNVPVPNLKHAPVSLAGALQEYLDDPNFEQNRLEYKANKAAAEGGPPVADGKTAKAKPSSSSSSSAQQGRPSTSSVPAATSTQTPKLPQSGDIQDFFASIEQQTTTFPSQTNTPVVPNFAQAAPNPFAHMTGNPVFMHQPQIAVQPTGFLAPQHTVMPQQPNPFGSFLAPQQTGHRPFSSYLPQQATGFMQPTQQAGLLQPQATGANPFRQSMLVPQTTGMALFGGANSNTASNPLPGNINMQQSGFMAINGQQPSSPMQTGLNTSTSLSSGFPSFQHNPSPQFASPTPLTTTNDISKSTPARPASTPLTSYGNATTDLQPVKTHQTGSRNPFGPIIVPAPPVPKPPTLFELSSGMGSLNLNQNNNGTTISPNPQQNSQQNSSQPPNVTTGSTNGFNFAQSALNPGAGDISSVASSFVFNKTGGPGHATNNSTSAQSTNLNNGSLLNSQNTSTTSTSSTFSDSLFSSTLSSQPTGATHVSNTSSSILKPQITGFAGLKPFKPSSSFGASLMESLPPIPGSSSTSPLPIGPATSNATSGPTTPSYFGSMSPTGAHFSNNTLQTNGQQSGQSAQNFLNQHPTGGFAKSSVGVGLRPQMTGGGVNPFRASMATGGGMPMSGTQAFNIPPLPSNNQFGSQFGSNAFGAAGQQQTQQQPQQNVSLI